MAFHYAHTMQTGDWFDWTPVGWPKGHSHTDSDVNPHTAPDELFHELDGTSLVVGGARWAIEIYSVVDDHDRRWIQVGALGPDWRTTTLRTRAICGAAELIEHLSDWLATDLPNGATLDKD